MKPSGTTIQNLEGTVAPSTEEPPLISGSVARNPQVGDTVLVQVDHGLERPLLVSAVGWVRVSGKIPPDPDEQAVCVVNGMIACEPDDHARATLRGWSQGLSRITGRPDRHSPFAYGEFLTAGYGLGQWRMK